MSPPDIHPQYSATMPMEGVLSGVEGDKFVAPVPQPVGRRSSVDWRKMPSKLPPPPNRTAGLAVRSPDASAGLDEATSR